MHRQNARGEPLYGWIALVQAVEAVLVGLSLRCKPVLRQDNRAEGWARQGGYCIRHVLEAEGETRLCYRTDYCWDGMGDLPATWI